MITITKYLLLYLAPVAAEDQMNVSPEEMAKGMELWFAWQQKNGSAIVDMGMPVSKGWNKTKKDKGEAKTPVAGYAIVQAENQEELNALLEDHPHFMLPGASIVVLEFLPMPGM